MRRVGRLAKVLFPFMYLFHVYNHSHATYMALPQDGGVHDRRIATETRNKWQKLKLYRNTIIVGGSGGSIDFGDTFAKLGH